MPSAPRPAPVQFELRDWGMLAAVALMWGASFLFIKLGLEDFPPATVAWLRIALGALALGLIPASRAPLRTPSDWRLVSVLGMVWMAVPFVLFTVAQDRKSTRLNSSHVKISYAVFCLKK